LHNIHGKIVTLLILILLISNLTILTYASEYNTLENSEQTLLQTHKVNPSTLKVYLPEGEYAGSNPDPWLDKGWLLYKPGNTWTFKVRVYQGSCSLESYDTHLIIAINDYAYTNLIDLKINGIRIPKTTFKHGRPCLYGIYNWPNDIYPTWYEDTYINLGKIKPKQYKEVEVYASFSQATNARIHFDAYGSRIPCKPKTPGDITRNANSKDSTVLWKAEPTPPTAHFTWTPPTPCINQPVTFDASASTPNGGTIISYEWNFGDGNITTTNNPTIIHTYNTIGNYTVTLKVTDSEGLWDTETKTIRIVAIPTVSVKPPEIIWTYQEHTIGETFTIDLYINNVTDLWSWQAGMTFNASALRCLSFEEGPFLKQGGTTSWTPGVIDNNAGIIYPHYCTLTGSVPVSGNGVLGTITFKVIYYGNSTLHPTNVILKDKNSNIIPSQVCDGSFSFIPPPKHGPTASFYYLPIAPYANQPITFNASESQPGWTGWYPAPIVNYRWDFGDGNITDTSNPMIVHYYAKMNTYIVTLIVTDSQGLSDTYSRTIIVDAIAPEAYFTWEPTYPLYGETVTFNASLSDPKGGYILAYEWNFGDGNIASGEIVTHAFTAGGTYNVTLTVYDSEGKSDTTWRLVSVLTEITVTPPTYTASYLGEQFMITIDVANITNLYRFEFKLSYNTTLLDVLDIEEGTFLKLFGETIIEKIEIHEAEGYIWIAVSLKPSSPPANGSGTLAIIEFNATYASAWPTIVGCSLHLYNTQLSDPSGNPILHVVYDGLYQFVPPIPVPPVAAFIYTPPDPKVNEMIKFDASGSIPNGGTITEYRWNFGDSNITTTTNPIIWHKYNAQGNFNVTLTVTDSEGLSDTTWQIISVTTPPPTPQPPTAAFTWTPTIGKVNEPVTFDASASTPNGGTIISYEWNFGDTGTGTGKIISHTYTAPGYFTVTLKVTDSEGLWDTETKTIRIVAPHGPTARFTASTTTPRVGQPVTFDASSSTPGWNGTHEMPITEYRWDFNGDGIIDLTTTQKIVTYTFTEVRTYMVTLIVYAPGASPVTDSEVLRIIPYSGPVGGYSFSTTNIETLQILYLVLAASFTAAFALGKRRIRRN